MKKILHDFPKCKPSTHLMGLQTCEIFRFPYKASSTVSSLKLAIWEALLDDKPLHRRKKGLILAYRGDLISADTVSYFIDVWNLDHI